ncbi:MAG: hypothetical protein HY765_09505 [Rhodomicrobium sp.]|nr:hypothetical protein [Rhodomicrobium sp.]
MRKHHLLAALALLLASSIPAAADGTGSTKDKPEEPATPKFDIAFGGYGGTDYVFRGISQSARWPSVSAYTELRYNPWSNVQVYVASAMESLDYPNRAAAEVDFYGGVRPTIGKLALDFGFWYYWYPGGRLFDGTGPEGPNPNCTNGFKFPGGCNILEADLSYWEVFGKGSYTVNDALTLGANVYYSPSWLNVGADGTYISGTAKITLPANWVAAVLPKDTGAYISGEFGHYSLGETNAFYGFIELPDYNTWNAGIAFTYKVFTLDFRYYDTDLTEANCNVLTADHTATFSPANITPTNPSGLGSSWCGSAFVAKLSFDLTANTNLK